MCSSARATFAWLGFLLVNAGFISLTAWGAAKLWPLGFALSAAYTGFLFWLAGAVQTWDLTGEEVPEFDVSGDNEETITIQSRVPHYPILPNLLYALGVVGLGVTGLFLPINLLSCSPPSDDYIPPTWSTDMMRLPAGDVRAWASGSRNGSPVSSFSHVGTTTFFPGMSDIHQQSRQTLWTVHREEMPREHAEYTPHYFVKVGQSTVCFQQPQEPALVCSCDCEIFRYPNTTESLSGIVDVLAQHDSLWLRTWPHDYNEQGLKIYSLEVDNMNLTCYSELQPASGGHNSDNCSDRKRNRQMAMGVFFATALPVLLASIVLLWKKQVPSMGLTTCIGASLGYMTIFVMIRPVEEDSSDWWENAWNYWQAIAGFLTMIVLSYAVLMKEVGSVLTWGLNTAGLGFMIGMTSLLLAEDMFWRWLLLSVLCFVPLVYLGALTNLVFLMFLGAFGFLMDAGRFAAFLGEKVNSSESFLVVFFTFACSGFALGAAGMQVSKYQDQFRTKAIDLLKSCHSCVRRNDEGNSVLLEESQLSRPLIEEDEAASSTERVGNETAVDAAALEENRRAFFSQLES
jgi:hypothetical protein